MTAVTISPEVDVSRIHDSIMDAIGIAEVDRVAVSLMPEDVFGVETSEPGWTIKDGLNELRKALFGYLGNEHIRNGEAESRIFRYSTREPHEFTSPKQPCVSTYLWLELPSGYKPYVVFEIGPSGGYPSDEL